MKYNKMKMAITVCMLSVVVILISYDFRLDRFGNAKIDWVDCVQINKCKYYRMYPDIIVEESLIGSKIGVVTFNVSENVGNSKYRFRDGDATILKVGSEIYKIKVLDNALAVKFDGKYHLYEKRE